MLKVSIENTNIKEEIIIDPYIPIKAKFGSFYSWGDETHFVRFGDYKHSMLEVGFSAEKGIIHSVALIGAKEIYKQQENILNLENIEEGIIVFNTEDFGGKRSTDIESGLVVTTFDNGIVLSISNDEVVKFVQNGKVNFGLNKSNELCCFVVSGFTGDIMSKLNGCLEYM